MDVDLIWADDDLVRASRLYERVCERRGESVDEAWESNGYRWRLIARRGSLPDGWPDAYLTAHRRSPRSMWRFKWRADAWLPVRRIDEQMSWALFHYW